MMRLAPLFSLLVLVSVVSSPSVFAAGSAERGKVAYVKNGCWQCHGYAAQGGIAGPKLAPEPMPLEAFSVFVRNTRGPMPPYPPAILFEGDLVDIHAWLQTLPKARDHRSIPLLNP